MVGGPIEDWIMNSISDEQMRPFEFNRKRSSILAAAGSGKTRTLTHLLAHDLCSGIPASEIVAFTFTEKAAEELLARVHHLRVKHMPNVDLTGMFVGTIHSWCLEYLYSKPEFYNFTPIDELHFDALAGRLYDELKLNETYGKPFPKAIGPFRADIEMFYNEHLALAQIPPAIAPGITSFLKILRANRLLTFGGMIRSTIDQLEANGPIADLKSLYVDEYQDVNPAQTALLRAMLPSDGQLRVVGDDLQSIYNWRGSDVRRILEFPNEFSPAEVFRLSTNYRSRPELVSIANAVSEDVDLRDAGKVMKPGRMSGGRKVVHWISTNNENEQAETIVEIVSRLHRNGVPYSKMAILLRSVVGAGRPIYEALIAANIPVECPVLSRGESFISSFLLPVLKWVCTEQTIARDQHEEDQQEEYARSLWALALPWVRAENSHDVFWTALNRWHDIVNQGTSDGYNVRSCLYDFLDECGIRVGIHDKDLMVGLGIASQIIRSVEEVHRRRMWGQKRRTAAGVIREVYFALRRNHKDYGESLPVNQNAEGVVLSTVHQAKGLEWPVVCLPTLNRRRFPLSNRPSQSSFPRSIASRYGTRLDDERRLFYVAVTRARERLFLLDTARAGKGPERSVFLSDLEQRCVLPAEGLCEPSSLTWSIDSDDLQRDSSPPIRVNLSDLLLYLECPFQFGLRRITGLQPAVGDELGFGMGLHELLQRRAECSDAWDEAEVVSQVDKHVHLPLSSDAAEKRAKHAIKERMVALDKLGAFEGNINQELPVEVFLTGGVVAGIVDFVDTQADGTLLVRDWKANVHDTFIGRYTRQLQFYVHALRTQGHVVSKAELVDVAASAREKALVTTEVDISEDVICRLIDACQDVVQGIRKGVFFPKPSVEACSSCDMRRLCDMRHGG